MERLKTYLYEFDEFCVDPARRLILGRNGRALRITPKAFDTLLYLVEHADVVLGKEALLRAIWADTAVEENNLTQCISALRRVLGEKRTEHRYIVTVSGRGYRFVAPVKKRRAGGTGNSDEPIRSIAVLPFQPLTRNHRDESLELGMADTLITRLSGIREIIVRPMSSVRKHVDSRQDALAAGRELGVNTVLEGSLQRQGARLRVSVRLLNVSDGTSLWAGTFDHQMTDIFVLQDAISEQVVQALSVQLSREDKRRLVQHDTQNTRAYEFYLKGRYHWWKNSPEEYKKSREYFHCAVEEDPSYALAYCGLNSFYGYAAAWGMIPPEEGWPKAEWAVSKALELDDQLAEAHLGLAALKMVYYLDWAGTQTEAKRAIELSPRFDEIHYAYSFFLLVMGQYREGIAEGQRALECNPFSVRISQHLGYAQYCARNYDKAVEQYRKALELDPKDASVCEALGDTHERNGEHRKAVDQWRRAMLLTADKELILTLGTPKTDKAVATAVRAVAVKRLDRLQRSRESGACVPAIRIAREHLRAGHQEDALRWLAVACEERNVYSLLIGHDPLWDPLRADRRFGKLLRRMKLR